MTIDFTVYTRRADGPLSPIRPVLVWARHRSSEWCDLTIRQNQVLMALDRMGFQVDSSTIVQVKVS